MPACFIRTRPVEVLVFVSKAQESSLICGPILTHYARYHGPDGDSDAQLELLEGVCLQGGGDGESTLDINQWLFSGDYVSNRVALVAELPSSS